MFSPCCAANKRGRHPEFEGSAANKKQRCERDGVSINCQNVVDAVINVNNVNEDVGQKKHKAHQRKQNEGGNLGHLSVLCDSVHLLRDLQRRRLLAVW